MDEPFDDEDPFMLRERSEQEVADYDEGFAAGSQGVAAGMAEAQE